MWWTRAGCLHSAQSAVISNINITLSLSLSLSLSVSVKKTTSRLSRNLVYWIGAGGGCTSRIGDVQHPPPVDLAIINIISATLINNFVDDDEHSTVTAWLRYILRPHRTIIVAWRLCSSWALDRTGNTVLIQSVPRHNRMMIVVVQCDKIRKMLTVTEKRTHGK